MNAEKWHHSEIGLRIAINDESQGSIAKNSRCNELLYYTFITHSAGERIFKIGEHLAKLRAKSLEVFINDMRYINPRFTYLLTYLLCHIGAYPICLAFLSSKMQISPDKLNNL